METYNHKLERKMMQKQLEISICRIGPKTNKTATLPRPDVLPFPSRRPVLTENAQFSSCISGQPKKSVLYAINTQNNQKFQNISNQHYLLNRIEVNLQQIHQCKKKNIKASRYLWSLKLWCQKRKSPKKQIGWKFIILVM